jgi:3-phosphoshikimate 1-carboxyvinyltransferase
MSSRNVRFEPSGPLRGSYTPPADKSISHRAVLFGAMADEPVTVRNLLDSADTRSTLDALLKLGAGVEEAPGAVVVRGVGLHAPLEATGGLLDVGNSGTLMRLLPGWLAGQPGGEWTLDGDESIRRRPIDRVAEPLGAMGAQVDAREGRFAPFTVRGSRLEGIDYEMPVASAQVKSCVLIAGMLAAGTTTITEPAPSRDHTERMLRHARVPLERAGSRISVSEVDELELEEIVVPGDPSSAAFMVAAATLVSGSRVVLSNVGLNWTRTGFFRIAERMGAVILGDLEEPDDDAEHEPVGELDVASSSLEGTVIEPQEVPLAIDELTLVALLGAFAEGETVLRGAEELRLKESDRIAAVVGGLRGIGADIEETDDGFVVRGDGSPLPGGTIDSLGDHRLAMLGAVAGIASTDGVEVLGMDAAAVSYPGFESDLRSLLGGD